MLEISLYATLLGLLLDIAGFLLVIRYGHSLFTRSGTGPPDNRDGSDGDLYLQYDGAIEGHERRRRFWAYMGVALVVVGFLLQAVDSVVAIHQCG